MRREFQFCHPDDQYDKTLELMRDLQWDGLPVVDAELHLVGMVFRPGQDHPAGNK